MATILENIAQSADGVQTLKTQLAAALRSKGVNPADKKLKDYPALVKNIVSDGGTAMDFYKCSEVNQETWNGYKAVLNVAESGKEYYEFEETLTEGLTYGKGFTPQVGRIYNSEATIIIGYLYTGGMYNDNETIVAVQTNSYSSDATTAGFSITTDKEASVDWGDGTFATLPVGSYDCQHDYGEDIGTEHIIRIAGDAIHRIYFRAEMVYTRVIKLGNSLTSLYQTFMNCRGLTRLEDTVQIPDGVTTMREAFHGCENLIYAPASLRLPAKCTDYYDAFYIKRLRTDMTHWFDNFADVPAGTSINMYKGFGGYLQNGVSGVTGTLPADLLWNNPNITWTSTAYCFYGRTSLSNYDEIPYAWKG